MTIESYGIIIGDGLYSTIVASSNGATQIVAATPGKIIKVLSLQIVANAAVNVQWSGTNAGNITGLAYLAQNGGLVLPHNQLGWFQTSAGDALSINLSSGVAVGGSLVYILR